MKTIVAISALLLGGCALANQGATGETQLYVESRHGRDVAVYAMCGRQEVVRFGIVPAKAHRSFIVPSSSLVCATGFRFVMVPEGHPSGFVTRPVARNPRRHIDLWIEKYPGLSDWRVQ